MDENQPVRNILIVEDDPAIAELVMETLSALPHKAIHADSGEDALSKIASTRFDIILLDLMLPGISGLDVCRSVREHNKIVPILMLTSASEDQDKIVGLGTGADDYMTKPFSVDELLARVRAMLRRVAVHEDTAASSSVREPLVFDELSINPFTRVVTLHDKPIDLSSLEFDLLLFLASRRGQPFTHEDLLRQVWGYDAITYVNTVKTTVNRLRKKIEKDPAEPKFVLTARGVGYRFVDVVN